MPKLISKAEQIEAFKKTIEYLQGQKNYNVAQESWSICEFMILKLHPSIGIHDILDYFTLLEPPDGQSTATAYWFDYTDKQGRIDYLKKIIKKYERDTKKDGSVSRPQA